MRLGHGHGVALTPRPLVVVSDSVRHAGASTAVQCATARRTRSSCTGARRAGSSPAHGRVVHAERHAERHAGRHPERRPGRQAGRSAGRRSDRARVAGTSGVLQALPGVPLPGVPLPGVRAGWGTSRPSAVHGGVRRNRCRRDRLGSAGRGAGRRVWLSATTRHPPRTSSSPRSLEALPTPPRTQGTLPCTAPGPRVPATGRGTARAADAPGASPERGGRARAAVCAAPARAPPSTAHRLRTLR